MLDRLLGIIGYPIVAGLYGLARLWEWIWSEPKK